MSGGGVLILTVRDTTFRFPISASFADDIRESLYEALHRRTDRNPGCRSFPDARSRRFRCPNTTDPSIPWSAEATSLPVASESLLAPTSARMSSVRPPSAPTPKLTPSTDVVR